MLNKYILCLYHQYCKATGQEGNLDNFYELSYEFIEWITQNQLLSNEYLDYLVYLGVISSTRIIEIDKGRYDSIAHQEMEIVSPYASSLNLENRELLIIESTPTIVSSKEIILPNDSILLTHNPYFIENLANWFKIHNSGKYNISIGMYGRVYDDDFAEKIDFIETLSSKMTEDHRVDYDTDNDKYFCTLNSNRKAKRLILTK